MVVASDKLTAIFLRRSSLWYSLGQSMWSASGLQAAAASTWASGAGCALPGSPFPSLVSPAYPPYRHSTPRPCIQKDNPHHSPSQRVPMG